MPTATEAIATPTGETDAVRVALAERTAPRYTSYPTAPHFSPAVDGATYRTWLGRISPCSSLSIYLHVPFCAAMCAYCGCHTKVVRRDGPIEDYFKRLVAEVARVGSATPASRAKRIHWGGGTPTMLGLDRMRRVVEALADAFDLTGLAEHAVELDPRQVTAPMARSLAALGVTRASLGVQDLNLHVQRAIGRVQPYEQVAEAVAQLRAAGVGALNIDLMYGLPEQSVDDLARTIDLAEGLAPDRVALFGYAHVPWMKSHQKLIDEAKLPDAAERLAQAEAAFGLFRGRGYEAIGLDHFAKRDDSLAQTAREGRLRRNFQGYVADDASVLIGFGASAIGKLAQGYVQNAADFAGYYRAIDGGGLATVRGVALTADDRLRAAAIERLMCDLSVDLDKVAAGLGADATCFDDDLRSIETLRRLGFVEIVGRRVRVTEAGRPFVRLAAAAFDAHRSKAGRHAAAV